MVNTELMDQQVNESIILRLDTNKQHPEGLPPQTEISETYKLFLEELNKGRIFNKFYKQLQTLRRDIIIDIANRNQSHVAKDLRINPVKMSAIIAMLKEMDEPQVHVTNPGA